MGNSLHSHLMNHDPNDAVDFSRYEEVCRRDADVQRFDANMQARTGKVLSTFISGANHQSLSFDSVKEVATSLLEMDRDVMEVILEYENDVWKNKDLFDLVEEFFDNSLATLEFCNAAENSIKNAKDNQSFLQIALNLIPRNRDPDEHEIKSIMSALDVFCQAENPFGAAFVQTFVAVQERHMAMLRKLKDKKRRLDKKLKNVQAWAKVSSILFVAAIAAVLICAVVAAAIAAPPVAGALAAASSFPLGSMGAWVKSMWKGYEDEIRAQRDVIQQMHVRTEVAIHDLDSIKAMASSLDIQLKAMVTDIQFARVNGDAIAITLAVESISKKRASFVQELDDLQAYIDRVCNRIKQARTIVLQHITAWKHRRDK